MFQKQLLALYSSYRICDIEASEIDSKEDYLLEHIENLLDCDKINFPYFNVVRKVNNHEILKNIAPNDPLTKMLMNDGVKTDSIALAYLCEEVCGDSSLTEYYYIRPLVLLPYFTPLVAVPDAGPVFGDSDSRAPNTASAGDTPTSQGDGRAGAQAAAERSPAVGALRAP
jgi:hypothetical protein